ncbi:MAG: diguanylate cyclase [Clostridiaceae bacterium]
MMKRLYEASRFFGLSVLTMGVVAAAFLGFRAQMKAEIQDSTFQQLTEAAQQQAAATRRYFTVAITRMNTLAKFGDSDERRALVENMISDLSGGDGIVWSAFADKHGNVNRTDGTELHVSDKDWFLRSLNGEEVVAVDTLDDSATETILISVPVYIEGQIDGALIAAMDQSAVSTLAQTNAFDASTYSLLTDSNGNIFAIADLTTKPTIDMNLFDLTTDEALQGDMTVSELKQSFLNGETTIATILRGGKIYYSVNVPIGVSDWYIVLAVPSSVADELSSDVLTYVIVMLCLVILVHTSVIFQAYLHERKAIEVLERDKELLRQSGERYTLINRLSNEVLFTVDMESGRILFNDSFEAMFGLPAPKCTLDHVDDCYQMVFEPDRTIFARFMEHMNAGAPEAHEELRMVSARGAVRWKRLEIYTVFDKDGRSRQVVGKISDIHRQKQSLQRLKKKADSDPLTGLLNRGAMEQHTRALLLGEGKEDTHAFIMLDFDNFKQVNDTLGHSEGDRMLIEFAHAVSRLFRGGDLVARLGGDEYTMLMKYIDSDGSALDKADQVRKVMAGISASFGVPVTVSVGISIYNRDGSTFEALYKAADEALYRVKKSGKDACALYSEPEAVKPGESTETEDQDNGTIND